MNDWQTKHFGPLPRPVMATRAAMPVATGRSWILIGAAVALPVVLAAGVALADQAGLIDVAQLVSRWTHPEAAAPAALAVVPAKPRPIAPPAAPVAASLPIELPEPVAPITQAPQPVRPDEGRIRAQIAQQERGVDLMGRELDAVDAEDARLLGVFIMRSREGHPPPRQAPYSAAERADEIRIAARNPRLTARQRADLEQAAASAAADLANATRRRAELADKRSSLQRRIDQAQAVAAQARAQLVP